MSRTCPACEGRSDDGHLCHACVRTLKAELTTVGKRWHDLRVTIARLSHIGPTSERPSKTIPNPYNIDAAALASDIRARLVGWVKLTMEDYRAALPHDSVPALCRFLIVWLPELRKHAAALELHREIMALSWQGETRPMGNQVTRAIDLPSHTRVKVGPCPEAPEGEPCSGVVHATFPKDVTAPAWMECGTCHWRSESRYWDEDGERVRQRERAIKRGQDLATAIYGEVRPTIYSQPVRHAPVLLTVPDAALTYGIPERTLRDQLGKAITRYGRRGLTLVDPAEVRSYHDSWLMGQNRMWLAGQKGKA